MQILRSELRSPELLMNDLLASLTARWFSICELKEPPAHSDACIVSLYHGQRIAAGIQVEILLITR